MSRIINPRIDALFVEGPDDGAVVNAFVEKLTGNKLGRHPVQKLPQLRSGG